MSINEELEELLKRLASIGTITPPIGGQQPIVESKPAIESVANIQNDSFVFTGPSTKPEPPTFIPADKLPPPGQVHDPKPSDAHDVTPPPGQEGAIPVPSQDYIVPPGVLII